MPFLNNNSNSSNNQGKLAIDELTSEDSSAGTSTSMSGANSPTPVTSNSPPNKLRSPSINSGTTSTSLSDSGTRNTSATKSNKNTTKSVNIRRSSASSSDGYCHSDGPDEKSTVIARGNETRKHVYLRSNRAKSTLLTHNPPPSDKAIRKSLSATTKSAIPSDDMIEGVGVPGEVTDSIEAGEDMNGGKPETSNDIEDKLPLRTALTKKIAASKLKSTNADGDYAGVIDFSRKPGTRKSIATDPTVVLASTTGLGASSTQSTSSKQTGVGVLVGAFTSTGTRPVPKQVQAGFDTIYQQVASLDRRVSGLEGILLS